MTPVKEAEFERTYNAPVEKVWQAWTDPEILKQWWGPNDVTIPECTVDLKVGGEVYIVMEAGEAMGPYKGTRWPMRGKYTVVEENSKLTYTTKAWTEGKEDTTEIDQVTEMTLTSEGDKTTVRLKVTINKIGSEAGMALEGMKYGFTQQLEKLANYFQA